MDNFIFGIVVTVFIVIVIVLLLIIQKTDKKRIESDKKLADMQADLDNVYSEVNNTQEELNAKYRQIKDNEDRIRKLAYEDQLTGLPNKSAFDELLGHVLDTLRKEESCAVMYVDLDNFKSLDDIWGHNNCDELILDISHRLRQNLDENDYIARMNGDEFIILSQNITDQAEYDNKVKRLEKALRFPFITSFGQVIITMSIGVAIAPKDGKKADVLLRNAGYALVEAKLIGKDTYCYFSEDIAKKELADMQMKSELTKAIKDESFLIRYEPVFDLRDKSCSAIRFKIVWDRGEKGIWHAVRFAPFAEKTGQIMNVGESAFRRSCKELVEMPNKKLIVPLTKKLIMSIDFESRINEILATEGIDRQRIQFEISEKVIASDFEDCLFFIQSFTDKGFTFRIGDFGNGLMSMKILRDVPVNEVAISVTGIYAEHDPEEAGEFLKLLSDDVRKFGKTPVYIDISDSIEEDQVIKNGGYLVEGELYGGLMAKKDILEVV